MDKSDWFKAKRKVAKEKESGTGKTQAAKKNHQGKRSETVPNQNSQKVRTVLFVKQTKDGKLAKRIREVLVRLEHVLGFRVKVVERTGTSIRKTLPNTNPWSGQYCSRKDCITFNQDAEEKPACTLHTAQSSL